MATKKEMTCFVQEEVKHLEFVDECYVSSSINTIGHLIPMITSHVPEAVKPVTEALNSLIRAREEIDGRIKTLKGSTLYLATASAKAGAGKPTTKEAK